MQWMAPSYNSGTPHKRKSDKEHFNVSVNHSLLNSLSTSLNGLPWQSSFKVPKDYNVEVNELPVVLYSRLRFYRM